MSIYKHKIGGKVSPEVDNATEDSHVPNFGQVKFTPITENQFGTHPAFTSQHELNAWLLGNRSGGGATTLNSPTNLSTSTVQADNIKLTWTDTNS